MLILERPWTRQPQTVGRVDNARPLAQNCIRYWPANVSSGGMLYEASRNANAALNSGVSWAVANTGTVAVFDGASGGGNANLGNAAQLMPGSVSFSCWVTPLALSKAYSSIFAAVENSGYQAFTLYVKNTGKLAQYVSRTAVINANYDGTGAATLSTNVLYHLCTTYDSGTGVATTYVNGVLDGSVTMSSPGALGFSVTPGFYFSFDQIAATREFNCRAGNFALFNRALTHSEIKSLYRERWQLFAPLSIYIPTAAAAATAPTITALSAISITATSAQPRISYS